MKNHGLFRLTSVPVLAFWVLKFCFAGTAIAQQMPGGSIPTLHEFPVVMQQTVTAGKTAVGTKLTAKLLVATLVNGTVIPRNAVFSGEVVESAAKTATDPSRLSIRMNSIEWKNGSATVQVYLTHWYFPSVAESGPNVQYGPSQNRPWDGRGEYPDPNAPGYKPFPSAGSDKDQGPDTSRMTTSGRRTPMKDVESTTTNEGVTTLFCKRSNIKLDKFTTYVFASGERIPAK